MSPKKRGQQNDLTFNDYFTLHNLCKFYCISLCASGINSVLLTDSVGLHVHNARCSLGSLQRFCRRDGVLGALSQHMVTTNGLVWH